MNINILTATLALVLLGCQSTATTTGQPSSPSSSTSASLETNASLETIANLAEVSQCAQHSWKNRGKAPRGYIKGMSLTFAKAVCDINRSDVQIAAMGNTNNSKKDALAQYAPEFLAANMDNSRAGKDTLRHAYTLLIGLGMRESSGKYCEGRDMSADFSTADSAEAGIFQASWGAHHTSTELGRLFEKYRNSSSGCMLSFFEEGVSCSSSNARNWGEPDENGFAWQKLTKECPAFATEYAAVLIRVHGGSKGEFGPLRRKKVELLPECDEMLRQVQEVVENQPELCDSL